MRALALLLFVSATLPMAFVRPIVGLMLWILFSYMNPHRIAWGFATNFPWVMISALVTLFSLSMHARQRQPITMTPVILLMTLFMIWTGVTTLTAVEPELAKAEFVAFFKVLMMAYVTLMLVTDRQKLHWVLWTVVLSFGFWGFKGGVFTLATGGSYHVLGPIHSFFRDNNDFGLVMCMTIPIMRYLQLYETRKWIRIGLWVMMGLTAVSVLGTYSRGGFLALSAVGFMLMLKSRRRAALLLVVPALALSVAAFLPSQWYSRINSISNYQQDSSAQGRIDSWKMATHLAIANPLLGGGFDVSASDTVWNRYGPPGAKHRAIHSIFFEVLAEHSFTGLALFIGMLLASWSGLARLRRRANAAPGYQWMADLASMMQVSLVGFVAAGTFLPMPYFDLFYQLLAVQAVMQIFLAQRIGASEAEQGVAEQPEAGCERPAARPASAGPVPSRAKSGLHGLPRW